MNPQLQQMLSQLQSSLSGLNLKSLGQQDISALFKSLQGLSQSLGGFQQQAPQPTQMTSPDGAVSTQGFGQMISGLPEPTAPDTQQQFQLGVQTSLQQAQQDFIGTAERQRDEAIKRQEEINAQLLEILSESDPRKRETFAQEEAILKDQLKAAQTAASTLEEDFKTRRRIVSEMEQLLTEGNALIKQQLEKPASLKYIQKSASRTMSDVQARAGVLQAVVAGIDGNLNMAHSIIGNASNAVRAQWSDVVEYNNAVLNLTNQGLLAIDKEHKEFAKIELALAESNLTRIEKTADYIKELMIDPKTAQFMADAGVSLNDSIEEINEKMSEQTKKMEIVEFQNQMTAEGYQFSPIQTEGAVSFEVGGKTLWFKPPTDDKLLTVAEAKSLGVPFGTTRSQAAAMGIVPGGGGELKPPTGTILTNLLGSGLTEQESAVIHNGVKQNGLRTVIEAEIGAGTDPSILRAISKSYGNPPEILDLIDDYESGIGGTAENTGFIQGFKNWWSNLWR